MEAGAILLLEPAMEGLAATGSRLVAHLAELGALGPHLLLTHMVHLDEAEVALLAETGANLTF